MIARFWFVAADRFLGVSTATKTKRFPFPLVCRKVRSLDPFNLVPLEGHNDGVIAAKTLIA